MDVANRKKVLIVGGSSGIGHGIIQDLLAHDVDVVVGGRAVDRTIAALPEDLRDKVRVVRVDLGDESTIQGVRGYGPFNFVVSLAAAHANGPVETLDAGAVSRAFDAKVIGPILLAKHLAGSIRDGGGFIFFSGVAAWKPASGLSIMATTNGAVAFLVEALAVELAPVRTIGISPGIIDSGAWNSMGDDGKKAMFTETAKQNPARRVGTIDDIVQAVRAAMENTFITGTTLHVDGGGHL